VNESDGTPPLRRERAADPLGKQALFDAPVRPAGDAPRRERRGDGKQALYSTGERQVGTVIVECGTCEVRTRTSMISLGVRMLPLTAWLPARRHPHLMRCPACGSMTWCRIGWNE
jgi:hypothetical protein